MILRFHEQTKRSLEGSTTEQMKWNAWHQTEFSKVFQLLFIMSPYAADNAVRTRGDFQQGHILDDRHHPILARDGCTGRAALRMAGNLINTVFNLVIHPQSKLIGKLVR